MRPRAVGARASGWRQMRWGEAGLRRAARSRSRDKHAVMRPAWLPLRSGGPRRARLGAAVTRRRARRRICTPVPFEGTLAEEDAMRDFQLRVAGFDSYALYAPGAARARGAARAGRSAAYPRATPARSAAPCSSAAPSREGLCNASRGPRRKRPCHAGERRPSGCQSEHTCITAGRAMRAAPRPKQPDYAPGPRVAAVVHPFLHPTPQAVVNRILLHYVAYHIRIGFAQVVQYTQARAPRQRHRSTLMTVS